MATFSPEALTEKLTGLESTQESIETLASWCIFHRRNANAVVDTWEEHLKNAPPEKKLPMLYLANDILQKSRRKGAEFINAFWPILPRVLRHSAKHTDSDARGRMRLASLKMVGVWEERYVFGTRSSLEHLRESITAGEKEADSRPPPSSGKEQESRPEEGAPEGGDEGVPEGLKEAARRVWEAERRKREAREAEQELAEVERERGWALAEAALEEAAGEGFGELGEALGKVEPGADQLVASLERAVAAEREAESALLAQVEARRGEAESLRGRLEEARAKQRLARSRRRAVEQVGNAASFWSKQPDPSFSLASMSHDERSSALSHLSTLMPYPPSAQTPRPYS